MKKLLYLNLVLFLTFVLAGCGIIHGYAPTVQQGNVLPVAKVDQLHMGLSKRDVSVILGSPVYINTFGTEWVYIYSLQPYGKAIQTKKVIITFSNNRIIHIEKNLSLNQPSKYKKS